MIKDKNLSTRNRHNSSQGQVEQIKEKIKLPSLTPISIPKQKLEIHGAGGREIHLHFRLVRDDKTGSIHTAVLLDPESSGIKKPKGSPILVLPANVAIRLNTIYKRQGQVDTGNSNFEQIYDTWEFFTPMLSSSDPRALQCILTGTVEQKQQQLQNFKNFLKNSINQMTLSHFKDFLQAIKADTDINKIKQRREAFKKTIEQTEKKINTDSLDDFTKSVSDDAMDYILDNFDLGDSEEEALQNEGFEIE